MKSKSSIELLFWTTRKEIDVSVRVTCERGVETTRLGVEKGRKIDGHSAEGKVMRLG